VDHEKGSGSKISLGYTIHIEPVTLDGRLVVDLREVIGKINTCLMEAGASHIAGITTNHDILAMSAVDVLVEIAAGVIKPVDLNEKAAEEKVKES
jgi:hypothetical protein